jgi:hypothetical protein
VFVYYSYLHEVNRSVDPHPTAIRVIKYYNGISKVCTWVFGRLDDLCTHPCRTMFGKQETHRLHSSSSARLKGISLSGGVSSLVARFLWRPDVHAWHAALFKVGEGSALQALMRQATHRPEPPTGPGSWTAADRAAHRAAAIEDWLNGPGGGHSTPPSEPDEAEEGDSEYDSWCPDAYPDRGEYNDVNDEGDDDEGDDEEGDDDELMP